MSVEGAAAGKRLHLFYASLGDFVPFPVRPISFSTSSTLSIFQSMSVLSVYTYSLHSSTNFYILPFLALFSTNWMFFCGCRNGFFDEVFVNQFVWNLWRM